MIKKAIIPVAGKGTRLMPITAVCPKAVFPLIDSAGKICAVLHCICLQAAAAGIQNIAVIISPWQKQILENYFAAARSLDYGKINASIEYIVQPTPAGFGDAVIQAKNFIADEPFVLLLGDYIYFADPDKPDCVTQTISAFESQDEPVAMIGTQPVGPDELTKVGTSAGLPVSQRIYKCTAIIEKPDLKTAREKLTTEGLEKDTFLAHCGIYIFSPEIYACLAKLTEKIKTSTEELELTEAQKILRQNHPQKYFLYNIQGRAFDTGSPQGYAKTLNEFSKKGKII